jgi:hypothetical protein
VCWYGLSAQTKAFFDRTFALSPFGTICASPCTFQDPNSDFAVHFGRRHSSMNHREAWWKPMDATTSRPAVPRYIICSGLRTIMNKCRCREIAVSNPRPKAFGAQSRGGRSQPRRLSVARRCLDTASWLVPGAILALTPKCPVCLAAYLAVWTGVGLSFRAAANLQLSLLILCVVALLCLAVIYLLRLAVANADILKPTDILARFKQRRLHYENARH